MLSHTKTDKNRGDGYRLLILSIWTHKVLQSGRNSKSYPPDAEKSRFLKFQEVSSRGVADTAKVTPQMPIRAEF